MSGVSGAFFCLNQNYQNSQNFQNDAGFLSGKFALIFGFCMMSFCKFNNSENSDSESFPAKKGASVKRQKSFPGAED